MSHVRRGFTLIELLTVMAIFAVLAALLTMFLSTAALAQRQALLRDRQRTEFARLDSILRADVHAAAEVAIESPGQCELKDNHGERWTYKATDEGLIRERWQGDDLRQRDVFYLRPGMEVEFSSRNENGRTLLELRLESPEAAHLRERRQQPYVGQMLVGGAIGVTNRAGENQP